MFKPARILVPTDMSEYSYRALREAMDLAKTYGSEVVLLHVIPNPAKFCTLDFCLDEVLLDRLADGMKMAAQLEMQNQLSHYQSMADIPVSCLIRVGAEVDEIIYTAECSNIDLIIIAPFGSTGPHKNLMGGTARQVLYRSPCSVLLLA